MTEQTAEGYVIAHCRSCSAEIVWALSEKNGKRQPIDAHPVVGGNIRMIAGRPPTSRVAGAAIDLFDPTDDGTRYFPHHMSCPNAADWKRGGEPKNPDTPGPKRWRTNRA